MDTTTETRDYVVTGMTCSHCVLSVREEVDEVPGVEDVAVDLASGRMSVTGSGFSEQAIKHAVAEAGYQAATA